MTPRKPAPSKRSARPSRPRPRPARTPNGLALTPDESILLVANANTNDVAAFNVSEPGEARPLGFHPRRLVSHQRPRRPRR